MAMLRSLDIRALGPGEQPDQPRALTPGHLAQLTGRHQELRVIEDDGNR